MKILKNSRRVAFLSIIAIISIKSFGMSSTKPVSSPSATFPAGSVVTVAAKVSIKEQVFNAAKKADEALNSNVMIIKCTQEEYEKANKNRHVHILLAPLAPSQNTLLVKSGKRKATTSNGEIKKNRPCSLGKCKILFYNKNQEVAHLKRHSADYGNFLCTICSMYCKTQTYLDNHNEKYHAEISRSKKTKIEDDPASGGAGSGKSLSASFPCQQCGKTYIHQNKLKDHIDIKHKGIKKKQCKQCFEGFREKKDLARHKLQHDDYSKNQNHSFSCHECKITFIDRASCSRHENKHKTGKKPIIATAAATAASSKSEAEVIPINKDSGIKNPVIAAAAAATVSSKKKAQAIDEEEEAAIYPSEEEEEDDDDDDDDDSFDTSAHLMKNPTAAAAASINAK